MSEVITPTYIHADSEMLHNILAINELLLGIAGRVSKIEEMTDTTINRLDKLSTSVKENTIKLSDVEYNQTKWERLYDIETKVKLAEDRLMEIENSLCAKENRLGNIEKRVQSKENG